MTSTLTADGGAMVHLDGEVAAVTGATGIGCAMMAQLARLRTKMGAHSSQEVAEREQQRLPMRRLTNCSE
jgi:hypothetical protein